MLARLRLKRSYFPNTCYKKNQVPSVFLNFNLDGTDLRVKIKVVCH